VEGVETDEELLTGSKDRWHFPSVPILFACHFLSHLVFFFFCHRNLICYPLAGRNALLLLPPRPWPPLERQQKAIRNLFFLSFFFFSLPAARTRTEACWLPSVALFRLLHSTPWCWLKVLAHHHHHK
jgi:hypothetical protein